MKKIIFAVIFLSIAILIASYLYLGSIKNTERSLNQTTPSPTISDQKLKTFKSSSTMDFTIQVPNNYQVNEKFGSVTISSNGGYIYIDMNGTNFNNINDYLNALHNDNKVILEKQKNMIINDLQVVSGFIGKDKNYYIYTDGIVYLLFTNSESLYANLDLIAQTFRYTP